MSEETKRVHAIVDRCVHEIGEHADSVRIFVSMPTRDGEPNTGGITSGCGNLYAQIGHVQEWLLFQEEYVRQAARKDAEEE